MPSDSRERRDCRDSRERSDIKDRRDSDNSDYRYYRCYRCYRYFTWGLGMESEQNGKRAFDFVRFFVPLQNRILTQRF